MMAQCKEKLNIAMFGQKRIHQEKVELRLLLRNFAQGWLPKDTM